MANQIAEFIAQFQANNAKYVAVVSGCLDEDWTRVGASDQRTVGVIAFHMATVQGGLAGLIEAIRFGKPTKAPRSVEELNRMNEDHARNHSDVTREDVVNALSASGAAFSTQLRFLTEADLDRSAGVLIGSEKTLRQVIQADVLAHQREHLDSIQGALTG